MRVANLFQRGDRFFVGPLSRTTAGVFIGPGRQEVLTGEVSSRALGEAVLRALDNSKTGISHPAPNDWPAIDRQFLDEVGARTMSAFMKSALCVEIALDGGTLRFDPKRNGGAKGGFVNLSERRIEIPAASKPDAIGGAARKALVSAE
jgi:hypothetical protein